MVFTKVTSKKAEAGEMAKRLRELATFWEGAGLVPSTIAVLQSSVTSVPRESNSSSRNLFHVHTQAEHS